MIIFASIARQVQVHDHHTFVYYLANI